MKDKIGTATMSHFNLANLAVFASLFFLCTSAPAGFVQPFVHDLSSLPLKRGISQDPSCPDGYLCIQEACPSKTVCPGGTNCLNFEGNLACGSSDLSFCAFNPNSFQAVGCSSGVCCHGNCYTGGTVCCENTSQKCTVGELCLACPSGQTCGNSGSCSGGSASTTSRIPSTTKISTAVPPASTTVKQTTSSQVQSTTKVTTAVVPTTTTARQATSSSSTTKQANSSTTVKQTTSTSTSPPTPTIVSSLGSFSVYGCYADAPDPRVLIDGSSTDHSANGMTVKKCLDAGKGFQFVGVEYYGECFWGDNPVYLSKQNIGDCNYPCDGAPSEVCGGGNRMLMYQDSEWVILSDVDFATQLKQLRELLNQLQKLLAKWSTDLNSYNSAVRSAAGRRKRGESRRQETALHTLGIQVNLDQKQILDLMSPKPIELKTIKIQFYLDIKVHQKQQKAIQAVEQLTTVAEQLETAANQITDPALTVPVIAEGALPVAAEVAAVAEVVSTGSQIASVVGTAEIVVDGAVVAVASGLFAALGALIELFGGVEAPQTTKPPTATTRTTTTTTTTTSSAAATTTYVVYPRDGTNSAQTSSIDNILSGIVKEKASIYKSDAGKFGINFWRLPMTKAQAKDISGNSNVASVDEACLKDCYDPTGPYNDSDSNLDRRDGGIISNTDGGDDAAFYSQEPGRPLSDYNGRYLYDASAGLVSTVYIVDTGAEIEHVDFSGTNGVAQRAQWLFVDNDQIKNDSQVIYSKEGFIAAGSKVHGTCMLSRVCGAKYGVAKNALPVIVRVPAPRSKEQYLEGVSLVRDSVADIGGIREGWRLCFNRALRDLEDMGVFIVTGSGNGELKTITGVPAYWASPDAPADQRVRSMIVVGAVSNGGILSPSSNEDPSGIPTVYGIGLLTMCAEGLPLNLPPYRKGEGTSIATADVAGLAAYFYSLTSLIGKLNSPADMKAYIEGLAWTRDPVNYPNRPAAWNGVPFQ